MAENVAAFPSYGITRSYDLPIPGQPKVQDAQTLKDAGMRATAAATRPWPRPGYKSTSVQISPAKPADNPARRNQ